MGYKKLVTILFLTTVSFFHLNLSSKDSIDLQLLSNHQDETTSTQPTNKVSLQMETFSTTNHTTFELPHRLIYPSQTGFREFIVPTLNSENICDLYKFFHSKNPSISVSKFLPAERFCKTHPVITTENEQKIVYNIQFGEEEPKTQFSKFTPIVYNPTDNTLEAINPYYFSGFETTPDGCPVANIEKEFFPFRPKLNTKPLGDENKTVMIAGAGYKFFLILEDSTNRNLKQYSLICYGQYEEERNQSILLFESRRIKYRSDDIEYPKDIDVILKAKYVSGIKKYFFKFRYEHFKFCQKVLKKTFRLIDKLDDRIDECIDDFYYKNLTIFQKGCHCFDISISFLKQAYILMTPYKVIIGAIFSPLYFYYSPKTFFLAFNLEPLTPALFWSLTRVHRDLELYRGHFKIYPLEQMFAIATLKSSTQFVILEFFYAWFIMFACTCTSFIYCFLLEKKIPGEFLE